MHEIMRTDPRRRYVLGLTIEDTKARFWFHDRCNVVGSDIFDIHTDWKKLVHIFYALSVLSSEDLGFDSTCLPVAASDQANLQYDFKFRPSSSEPNSRVYRTVGLISDTAVNNIIGHGTRVWKVQKLDSFGLPNGPFYALKDTWMHCGRDPEHEIIAYIIVRRPNDAAYFLTVVDAEFVAVKEDEVYLEDNTHLQIRRDRPLEPTGSPYQGDPTPISTSRSNTTSGKSRSKSSQLASDPPVVQTSRTPGHRDPSMVNKFPRRHYRMVSKELGVSLYNVRNFSNALLALEGGFRGLHAGHKVGYIHRDVSAGNIMFFEDGRHTRGIIMDWECAKRHDDKSASHDVKTGTAAFMSTEVSDMFYRHEPLPDPQPRSKQIVEPSAPAFRQNYLHDHESNWWIALWLLFTLFPQDRRSTGEYARNFNSVFKSSSSERWDIWSSLTRRPCFSHLFSPKEKEYRSTIQYWNHRLKKLYEGSYTRGEYWVPSDATIDEAHTLELEALEELRECTKGYPAELLFIGDLRPARTSQRGGA